MKQAIAELFHGWEETLIWSCLQGIMGQVVVDDEDDPKSALAKIGSYASFGFLAGRPTAALIESCRGQDMILVPQNQAWSQLIEANYADIARPFNRYATRKDTVFDRERLEGFAASLPAGFALKAIDEDLYQRCLQESWSRDLVANYADFKDFKKLGLGYLVLRDNQPVSGASSYSTYKDGIEIEVDTHPNFRQKGLAQAVSARLILACLDQGRYPSWDAHNKASLALAEKLGYTLSHAYPAYEFDW